MSTYTTARKILFLAANPKGTSELRLGQEVRDIEEGLKRSQKRDQFLLDQRWAVRPKDVRRAMLDSRPQIVHFAGHGVGEEGLVLENETGYKQFVTATALAGLFKLFADQVECVILNACYSKVQAEAIAEHINYVIGIKQAIGDQAALEFSLGFYDALAAGKSIEFAYDMGCNAIEMAGIAEETKPILHRRATQKLENSKTETKFDKEPIMKLVEDVSFSTERPRIFISYRSKDPDKRLAHQFYESLKNAGYEAFMAGESIRWGENWVQRVDTELELCDYFLLLLSPLSAVSEMVTEEVRQAKKILDSRAGEKPKILPIRVNLPMDSPLNYDLRAYLQHIQQKEWNSPSDTPKLVQEILELIAEKGDSGSSQQLEIQDIKLEDLQKNIFSPDSPPLPVAEPELPGGQVDLCSTFYVDRPPIETRAYEAILKPGALIRIKAPRQMGKTSLMARILHHAGEENSLTVALTFQIADSATFKSLDKFLKWFCASISRRLDLPHKLDDYWDEIFSSKDNCTAYFEEYLLVKIDKPLTLGLDEVDLVFQYPDIASDFFGLLRTWHEASKNQAIWKNLRLVVVHSTEVYIPMNINQSPFNVGLPIELPEFTLEQIEDLAQRHQLKLKKQEIFQLRKLIGGHPYLVRVALYNLAKTEMTLPYLLQSASTEEGPYGDHLRRHLWNLEQKPELLEATKQVVNSTDSVRLESVLAFQLYSMGLVNREGNNVTPRCELYRQYFRDRLGKIE